MELLNEIITHWYPVLFLISSGIALAVWARSSKRKARMDIPWWEAVMGIVQTFILGWLIGALVAAIYNAGSNR